MGERLKMQDRLKAWERRPNQVLKCSLCNNVMDSHSHLFFECTYSARLWQKVRMLVQIDLVAYDWKSCRDTLMGISNHNSSRMVLAKLCLSASVYYLWHERNVRLFKGKWRTVEQLFETIWSNIRLKLMSIRFKSSQNVQRMKRY
ncbi:uncharacterized protein [Rutidosis leptorrhynchoides]|uniref:uncharacterized protein n=1 Tax=Rutidosis leptorrhynchoides TaxID=125765 RepID=UPI003A9A2655